MAIPEDVAGGDPSHDVHHNQLHDLYNYVEGLAEGRVIVGAATPGVGTDLNLTTEAWISDADDISDTSTTNKFTTAAEISKLAGIEAGATADQTGAQIKTAYEAELDTNAFDDAAVAKLAAIEALADVTDATNVNAAGAVMTGDTSTAGMGFVVDEDTMVSNSSTKVPTQQSVKQYVDDSVASAGGGDMLSTQNLADLTNTMTARANLGVAIGTNVQAYNSVLDATTASFTIARAAEITANNAKVTNATHTGEVTGSGALTIANNAVVAARIASNAVTTAKINTAAVTNAKLANMADSTVKGRATGVGTGVPVDLTATQLRTIINVEDGADVTDTANVTAAGALMDSEVDVDIKTLSLPASTTISTFGASLVDDADAATARTTLGLGGVEDGADVTDSANVTAALETWAGALPATKATPISADQIPVFDSVDGDSIKLTSFSNFATVGISDGAVETITHSASGTLTLDFSAANAFVVNASADITDIVVSNGPASGNFKHRWLVINCITNAITLAAASLSAVSASIPSSMAIGDKFGSDILVVN